MLAARSNDHVRYEYLDHDLVFEEPKAMSTEEFEIALQMVHQEYEDMATKAAAFLED